MVSEFGGFLIAKRRIDDRALNRQVWSAFATAVEGHDRPVRILEIGSGVGTMIERCARWLDSSNSIEYRAVELDPGLIGIAHRLVPAWLSRAGYHVQRESGYSCRPIAAAFGGIPEFTIRMEHGDGFTIDATADVVIAAALMDLVDLEEALPLLAERTALGGFVYMPLTFDGLTGFIPPVSGDERIETLYHRHMSEIRDTPGGPHAGRSILTRTRTAGFETVAAGGADWVIVPRNGRYRVGEQVVLSHMLDTIEAALLDYPPEICSRELLDEWLSSRRQHLSDGELGLVVHHLDVLVRKQRVGANGTLGGSR